MLDENGNVNHRYLFGNGVDQIEADESNGNDLLNGGAGNDTLNGGADIDTASYLDAIAAVNVSLTNGTAAGGAGLDTLISTCKPCV